MPDLADGQQTEMQGSGAKPYILKNVGGVYSCSCPAWRNQSLPIERRTCKHLRKLRGDAVETARVGQPVTTASGAKVAPSKAKEAAVANEPPVLLAESWDGELNLAGWLMSEKLDGVRAWWDGQDFVSRKGHVFHAPDWFKEGLPKSVLDGELWLDRKRFDEASGIARRHDKSAEWKKLTYVVFDVPGERMPFSKRVNLIQQVVADAPKALALAFEVVKSNEDVRKMLAEYEALGAEGLMARHPDSYYESGRSSNLLKVKSFTDAEAVVTGYQAGKGRHKGRVGALEVKWPDDHPHAGVSFEIGTGLSDYDRDNPPPVGQVVTFKYTEINKSGKPRFPSYLRMRDDA